MPSPTPPLRSPSRAKLRPTPSPRFSRILLSHGPVAFTLMPAVPPVPVPVPGSRPRQPPRDTHVPSPLFRVAMQRRLRMPIWECGTACGLCGEVLDRWGDRALCCGRGDRVLRHNAVRNIVCSVAEFTSISPLRSLASCSLPGPTPVVPALTLTFPPHTFSPLAAAAAPWGNFASPFSSSSLSLLSLSAPVSLSAPAGFPLRFRVAALPSSSPLLRPSPSPSLLSSLVLPLLLL